MAGVFTEQGCNQKKAVSGELEQGSAATEQKIGNYLVFLPSYKYMELIIEEYAKIRPDETIIVQKTGMTEEERSEFLNKFRTMSSKSLIAFAVMGGIFGEGIDLIGEHLSGVIIAGVGLPQINLENNILKEYFREAWLNGFNYAYTLPGFNRVLQAAGRVIRTEKDRGFVLLIDKRFSTNLYKQLFPSWWKNPYWVTNSNKIRTILDEFWKSF